MSDLRQSVFSPETYIQKVRFDVQGCPEHARHVFVMHICAFLSLKRAQHQDRKTRMSSAGLPETQTNRSNRLAMSEPSTSSPEHVEPNGLANKRSQTNRKNPWPHFFTKACSTVTLALRLSLSLSLFLILFLSDANPRHELRTGLSGQLSKDIGVFFSSL